jgi:hypothetical protein
MGGRERAQDHSNGTASDNSAHTSQPGMPKTGTSGMPDQAPRCVAGGCSGARQPPRTVARPTRSARRTMQRRCGAAGGMTFLRRDSPFTQTTRRPARRLGRDRAGGWTVRNDGLNRTVSDAYSSGTTAATTAIDLGAAANQAAWLLTMVEAANSARLSIAIKQPPQVIRLGRRVGVVVGHSRPCCRRGRRRPPAWRLGASGGRRMLGIRGRPIGGSRRRRTPERCPTSGFATPSIPS